MKTRSQLVRLFFLGTLCASPAFASDPMVVDALAEMSAPWSNIKDYPYEKRADFIAVFTRMVERLDNGIRDLKAKRAAMTKDTQAWDFAAKELDNARWDVRAKSTELSQAAPQSWVASRDKLGIAWQRAVTAYFNVRGMTM